MNSDVIKITLLIGLIIAGICSTAILFLLTLLPSMSVIREILELEPVISETTSFFP